MAVNKSIGEVVKVVSALGNILDLMVSIWTKMFFRSCGGHELSSNFNGDPDTSLSCFCASDVDSDPVNCWLWGSDLMEEKSTWIIRIIRMVNEARKHFHTVIIWFCVFPECNKTSWSRAWLIMDFWGWNHVNIRCKYKITVHFEQLTLLKM